MLIEGEEVDDDWPMSDWMTRTGKSEVRVSWKMERPYQKFWLWIPTGEVDLGEEFLDRRPPAEMLASLS
jgi:hypothetical protein